MMYNPNRNTRCLSEQYLDMDDVGLRYYLCFITISTRKGKFESLGTVKSRQRTDRCQEFLFVQGTFLVIPRCIKVFQKIPEPQFSLRAPHFQPNTIQRNFAVRKCGFFNEILLRKEYTWNWREHPSFPLIRHQSLDVLVIPFFSFVVKCKTLLGHSATSGTLICASSTQNTRTTYLGTFHTTE